MLKEGRLELVRSVLAAILVHQLMMLSLNKRALKQVEKILRGFLSVGCAGEEIAMSSGRRSVDRFSLGFLVFWIWVGL